jgi:hypothetical protein
MPQLSSNREPTVIFSNPATHDSTASAEGLFIYDIISWTCASPNAFQENSSLQRPNKKKVTSTSLQLQKKFVYQRHPKYTGDPSIAI